MNSKESKFTSGTDLLPKIDFSPTHIPEINASIFEANDSFHEISDRFTKVASHLDEKVSNVVEEITNPLDEKLQQFTGITSYRGENLHTGITSCMETISESLTALQVEAPSLKGLSTIESLGVTGFDVRSTIESLCSTGFDVRSTIESLCSTGFDVRSTIESIFAAKVTTSSFIGLSGSTIFSSSIQNIIESCVATQIETLSNTISPSLNFQKTLEAKISLPHTEMSKGQYTKSLYQQRSPIHPILKSENTKKRDNLYGEILLIVSDQHADCSLNLEAYELLYSLEVSLRKLINIKLIEPYRKNLSNRIPKNMLDSWKDKKLKEKPNSFEDDSDLIDYSDFTDLKTIIEMRKNYKLFNDIFTEEEIKILISKLCELNPIRVKIAHSRALTTNEACRFILYSKDILTRLSM